MKLRSLSWAYLPEGTEKPCTTKGLNMRTCEDWKGTFKCWSRLTPAFSYIAFIMLRYVPYIPAFWRVLIIKVLNFVKGFFCIY